jgi:hypothetical protein
MHKKSHYLPPEHYYAKKKSAALEQLQQFGKPTWHLSDFGKIRKISLQQFGKPTWQK